MSKQDARKLLQKYRSGHCTPEEKSWVEQWYLEMAQQKLPAEPDVESHKLSTWKSIQRNIAVHKREKSFLTLPAFRIAASVLLLVGIWFAIDQNGWFVPEEQTARVEYISLHTENGALKEFILPDGSHVWLNGGSRLTYPSGFNDRLREVVLEEGEAYFDVKHNREKPFIVEAGQTRTQVLGTAFAIRSYQGLQTTQITVSRGKVGVMKANDKDNKPVFLLPDEQVTFDKTTGELKKTRINAADFISWTQGKLQINNESLADIAVILEKKFNASIHFKDKTLSALRFSAGFEAQEKLDDILEVLCLAENLKYSREQNVILLSNNK